MWDKKCWTLLFIASVGTIVFLFADTSSLNWIRNNALASLFMFIPLYLSLYLLFKVLSERVQNWRYSHYN